MRALGRSNLSPIVMFKTYLAVMAGGAVGTGLRLALSTWFDTHFGVSFPVGTLFVNITGCFIIGLFAGLTAPSGFFQISPMTSQTIIIGVLGGYTTFSSFGLQTHRLLLDGRSLHAMLNILSSITLCLLAVWLGQLLASLFPTR